MIASVIMITYGHAPFIAEAIQGVLMQKTNFEIELIIADDCSPDNTSEVVNVIINENKKAKEIIRYTRHEKNKGMMPNLSWAIQQARGEYIAFCEGDDYWTNPNKLQMQVDFLEKNRTYSGCCHNMQVFRNSDLALIELFQKEKFECDFTTIDFIKTGILCNVHTASMVFRSSLILNFIDDDFQKLPFGDKPILVLLSAFGPFHYFPEVMGMYRKHTGGFTAVFNWDSYAKDFDFLFTYLNKKLQFQFDKPITKILRTIFIDSVNVNLGRANMVIAKKSMKRLNELLKIKDYFKIKVVKTFFKYYIYMLFK